MDDAERELADARYNMGKRPVIVRSCMGANSCEWCLSAAGEYEYGPQMDKGHAFGRHANCDCLIEYDPGTGKTETVRNYHLGSKNREALLRRDADEMQRRRIGRDGQEIIDKPTYRKLTRDFERQGGVIIRGEEAERHLKSVGAYASYIVGGNAAYIRDDATISDVLEEMFHAMQDRKGHFVFVPTPEVILRREIEAQEYLLSVSEKYKIPTEQREITRENLRWYQRELEKLAERGEKE